MTKSSVDRNRSRYGEKYSLRFHKQLKIYHLSCNDESPSLIAKFVETDGDLAMDLFERLESNYKENKELKSENQSWLKTASHSDNVAHNDRDYAKKMHKENKELKGELAKFKEWKKHIGDVKREELDKVFKMSIYEIAEAFDYYKERIKKLEKELQRND